MSKPNVDEQLLDELAHEDYEFEEDETSMILDEPKPTNDEWYWTKQELIDDWKRDACKDQCLHQYAKDCGHVDEMDELVDKFKKEEKTQKEWTFQIQKLEEEPIVEEASFESLVTAVESHNKQQKEELLSNSYLTDQMDDIKFDEQHKHVLPMDDNIKDIKECEQHQLEQDEMTHKYKQEREMAFQIEEWKKAQVSSGIEQWYKTQLAKQNTNVFFFNSYK